MGKRGRPRKNGAKPDWMLGRVIFVLNAYHEARSSGLKHSSAVTEAVAAVKRTHPNMPISETEVKRVLANYQAKGVPIAFMVTKDSDSEIPPHICEAKGIPKGSKAKAAFAFEFGPRPEYPRI